MTNKKLCLIDFVGTLFDGTNLFADSKSFLESLQANGFDIFILSNTTIYSKKEIAAILTGCRVDDAHILSISSNLITTLKKDNHKNVYLLGTDSLCEELKQSGFTVYRPEDHNVVAIEEVPLFDEITSVVVATDPKFSFFGAALGTRYVIEKKTGFYSVGGDRRFYENSHFYPGSYALSTSIKTPTFKEPALIGKPNPEVFDTSKYDEVWVVGDNVETDIEFANKVGAKSVLVLTGVSKNSSQNDCAATVICHTLSDAQKIILK